MVQRQFESLKNIDFIGDIHGFGDELEQLLLKLDYQKTEKSFQHPDGRKVIFVGDYVDRGPKILKTLKIVRSMAENGQAIALMGNHEYNLLGFFTESEKDIYLRKHSINKIYQALDSLYQFRKDKDELNSYLDWILTLPLFFENKYFRAVHATWYQAHVDTLKMLFPNNSFNSKQDFIDSFDENNKLFAPINVLLKGLEFILPNGMEVRYGDFIKRDVVRVRWWEHNFAKKTYRNICVHKDNFIPDIEISSQQSSELQTYKKSEKPVFFGHYWMSGNVELLAKNICCLDFSIAKEHKLVAYRFNGEKELDNKNFVWVNCCI